MDVFNSLQDQVLNLDESDFEEVALRLFQYQSNQNPVYRQFIENLKVNPSEVSAVKDIPFLPVELFKIAKVATESWEPEAIFVSSGTTGSGNSKHFMRDLSFYDTITLKTFEHFYGPPDRYHILALLPSYLDRQGSSLAHMMNHLITISDSIYSGFYLRDYEKLAAQITAISKQKDRTLMLWGVSFALMDFAELGSRDLSDSIVVETGGMKGRREEIIRDELHEVLKKSFLCNRVHSEYGMAELSSQAYAVNGQFQSPAWMRILIRDITDPFAYVPYNRVGGINVIDLANIHSCSFIETQDLGRLSNSGVEILGRMDNSDVRGCNLMVT